MTWTAVAGKSPVQSPGSVVTIVTFTTDGGKSFEQECRYDGTLSGLVASARAVIAKVDPSTSKVVFVEPGTPIDLSDPIVQPPPAPPAGLDVWLPTWIAYVRLTKLFALRLPGVTQERVDAAYSAQSKLYDAAFEDWT